MFTKAEALAVLRGEGWILNRPEEMEVVKEDENYIVLHQAQNGEWIVSPHSSSFFPDDDNAEYAAACGKE